MKKIQEIGFPISQKENEYRRATIPTDLETVNNCCHLYFEKGYGEKIGYSDSEYEKYGCHMVSHAESLSKDIICDAKIGDAEYLSELKAGQVIFGWIHAVQNRDITDKILDCKATAIAWEDMFCKGRHCFWRNNEVAGEAAIMHAFQCYGKMPYGMDIALIGQGNVARGALKILTLLGANVTVYNRKTEALFHEELPKYDVVVNGVLWDTSRKDHIVYKKDLQRMKKNSFIIDISCDNQGGIETSMSTTIENPVYFIDSIMHYVVDHTPSLFYKTATSGISNEVVKYLDDLCESNKNDILEKATCIRNGIIIDQRINAFQRR